MIQEQLSTRSPSPEIWRKVARRIEEEAEKQRHSWEVFDRFWSRPRFLQAALAAVVVVIVCTLSLLFVFPREEPFLLVDELVKDHLRALAKEGRPGYSSWADPAEIVGRLRAKALASSASLPFLIPEGVRLVGGSFCQLGKKKGIRLVYEVGRDRTISFYQLERPEHVPFPQTGSGHLYIGQPQRPGIVLWEDAHFLYALVGELPPEELQRLALHMRDT